ncbi:PP0621 family protein [Pseudomonas sp. N040]|uniref:PP0621 family protein n=1 Tax=Pseudomonas sp. N040 TaxID=2785325 RepID=UPI0018A313B1|nr:PP0621 family protein [Pseudomonas sp. N040]MBF7730249.1 hypothetical protein [Pseudomonas sp. N040]MBW7013891.1 hypothetical protein [Pseudomonas sp. N040]
MFRLLIWIALIVAAVWLWRRLKNPAAAQPPSQSETQPMVRCAHCGLHVPQREAQESAGNWYCSTRHLELGPRQSDQ